MKSKKASFSSLFHFPSENSKEGRDGRQHGVSYRKAVSFQFPSHPKVCAGNPSETEVWRMFLLSPREASI